MNPVRGIETKRCQTRVSFIESFKLMNPVRGIETNKTAAWRMDQSIFQINESRSRD